MAAPNPAAGAVDALRGKALSAYKAFTPAQLVIIGLLGVLGIVGVMTFASWAGAPTYGVLFSGMQAKDAAAVTTKLQSDGVAYKLANGGTTVLVPTASLDKERIALSAAGLPTGGSAGWEVLDKQGLTTSSFQQQVGYQRALEGEISRTLRSVAGVRDAQVHLVLPQESVFSTTARPARASVLLDTFGNFSSQQVSSVIALVSGAVPDLDPSAVSVSDSNGHMLSQKSGDTSSADAAQQNLEDSLSAQAQTMLDQLLGSGHAVVRVIAEVDKAKTTSDSESYDPTKVVTLTQDKTSETYSAPSPGVGGPLTVTNTTSASASPSPGNGYTKTSDASSFGVSRTVNHSETAAGSLKRLSVAVAVDSAAKNVPPTAQLTQLVAAAVGSNPARGDSVVVTATPFTAATAATTGKGGATAAAAGGGASSGSMLTTGIGAGVLLLIVILLARALRQPHVTDIPLAGSYPALPAGSIPRQQLPAGETRAVLGSGGGPRPVDLLGVVDNQPDDVAALLKGWLAESPGAHR